MRRDDVLIVGAGVIGLSCALELLEAGRGVVLVDAGRAGGGSSHGNCGTITPSHATPLAAPGMVGKALRWMLQPDAPLYVKPRLDPALARWLLRFAARCNARDYRASARAKAALLNASRELLEANVRREGLDCEFAATGSIYVYRDAAALDAAAAMIDSLHEHGVRADLLDAAALSREEPALRPGMAGGVLFPGDASLRPDRLVSELARRVRERGGEIVEYAPVETFVRGRDGHIERVIARRVAPAVPLAERGGEAQTGGLRSRDMRAGNDRIRIGEDRVGDDRFADDRERGDRIRENQLGDHHIRDEHAIGEPIEWHPAEVILATGAWSPLLVRQLGLRLPVQPGKGYSITYSRPAQVPRRPLVLRERSVCVTAWESGFRLGSTMEFSGYDTTLNRVRLDALARGAAEYLHAPVGAHVREEWYGWRPMTWDDLPLLGRVAGVPNLALATGHGMLGVSMSAITGRLIAELVTARATSLDLTPYSAARFS